MKKKRQIWRSKKRKHITFEMMMKRTERWRPKNKKENGKRGWRLFSSVFFL